MFNQLTLTSRSPAVVVDDSLIYGGITYEQCCNPDIDLMVGNTVSAKVEFTTTKQIWLNDEFEFRQKQYNYSDYELMGCFKVFELDKLATISRYKVVAYDNVYKFDTDVKTAYDNYWSSSPTPTVRQFFNALCGWVGCTPYTPTGDDYTNFDLVISQKPVDGMQINGRDLLGYIAAVAAGFIYADTDGTIKVKQFGENTNIPVFTKALYKSMDFADVTVPVIQVVRVANGSNDTGVEWPSGGSGRTLNIPYNAIFYNESAATMQSYVHNIYDVVSPYRYVPVELTLLSDKDANGYKATVGDKIQFQRGESASQLYNSFVFTKKITPDGVYIQSTGRKTREVSDANSEIQQLAGKYNRIVNDVTQHSQTLGDLLTDTSTTFKIDSNGVYITKTVSGSEQTVEIDGASVKASRIDASEINTEDLNMSGRIAWTDISSSGQTAITDRIAAATTYKGRTRPTSPSQGDAWYVTGSTDVTDSTGTYKHDTTYYWNSNTSAWQTEEVELPAYIKSTYIDMTQVASPLIRGQDIELQGGTFSIKDLTGSTQYGFVGYGNGSAGTSTVKNGVVLAQSDDTSLGFGDYYVICAEDGVRVCAGNYSLVVRNDGIYTQAYGGSLTNIGVAKFG